MKKESVFVMLFVLFVLGGSGNIVPVCAAVMGGGGGPGTPCEDMDIMLIMDCSGSMSIMDAEVGGSTVSRMDAAKVAAKDFIDLLPTGTNTRVGVVSYESYGAAGIEQPLTTAFTDAKTAIDGLSAGAMTAMTAIGEGLEMGKDELTVNGTTNRRVFLLLTDGIANRRPPGWSSPAGWVSPPGTWNPNELYAFVEAHDAMTLDVTNPTNVYTVGMGNQTKINEYFLEVLAHSSGGEYFYANTTAVSEMFDEVRADICYGDIRVLILSNLDRMDDLGMDPAPSDLVSELQDLADNNPNERGVAVDLGDLCDPSSVDYNAPIDTAYSNWDGHEGDVTLTNALVDAIDDYIEDLKQTTYPLMRYVIIVGSHEVIPMKARPDDYSFVTPTITYNERQWADDSLPLANDYIYDLYHAGADGHYMTDTPYSDLSYLDTSKDHELTPELSVSRLVETPQQIVDVINTYMAANGIIPRNNFVSIASNDYLDGGTLASDYMIATGVITNDSLVQCSYSSSDVPPLLNAEHDVVYFAGHGEYNVISTNGGSFRAGNSTTQGDTDDTNSVDGAVIITSGCHNGVNFGNTLYHAPDAGTTYSEFPEEFAENSVVAYIGATGYTVISDTDCSTTASSTGYNEKLATNVVYYTVNCVDIGRAFRNGAKDYYRELSPIQNVDRRVLAIPTLYGIPTYRDPVTPESAQAPGRTPAAGTDVMRTATAAGLSEVVTVNVSDYTVESSGIVTIPGLDQVVSFNEPILPQVFVEGTFPRGSVVSVEWLEGASEYVVVKNNVPIAGIACGNVSIPGKFYYQGFWPPRPHRSYQSLTFGAGGTEVGFGVHPVQYNPATGETKIWTMMKFYVNYRVRPTGISVVSLDQDKPLYASDDTMRLNVGISSSRHTSLMNLGVVMRDMDTGKKIATMEIGRIGLEGGATTRAGYSVDLGSIPPNLLEGRTVAVELIVSDSHNGDILASRSFEFEVAGKSRIFFSTEEDFVTQGPKPQDGNPIISDGDLLCSDGTIIARNRELLKAFETEFDLGLDASDVIAIDATEHLVLFSTELNDPKGQFTAGDLLTTTGAVIPNIALLAMFDIPKIDLGLDAVHFTGDEDGIIKFLEYIADEDADMLQEEPEMLSRVLEECDIDIWFSTEGTAPKPGDPLFLDGDLLSARYGTIVARNSELLPASVPAGIPDRGVDFGLDAATTDRTGNVRLIEFSTEILYEGEFDFTDGDVLRINNGVIYTNRDVIAGFEPKTGFLGLDALSILFRVGKPDMVIGEISLEEVDRHCRLSYHISNAGTASAPASTTYLYVDGEKVAEDSTSSLAAGTSAWDAFSYQITGKHTFEVCADGINEIDEIGEANNCRTVELACQQPIIAGNIIYHESRGAGIWRMNPDGSGNMQLSGHGWFAEYSPDNTKIAFGEYYHDGIWMMDADGTNQKQVTKSGSAPTWSPDGKKIAYHEGDPAGASRSIWVIAADGTNSHQLSDNPGSFPKWSPDNMRIAYHGEVNSGIWLINHDGTGETLLHSSGGYPAWSPDGKKIAYASLTDWCIWTIAADGTGATKLTDTTGIQPTWSPDGTKVAYEDLANNEGIRVVNADGTDDHLINKVGHAPDWSEGSAVLPEKSNLAYIYSADAASAESYKSLLDVNEYPTTLIPMGNVANMDFSEYGAIIAGSDTGYLSNWGDSISVGVIYNSGKPTIGLGEGGYALFGQSDLSTGWPNGWHGSKSGIRVVDPTHPIFNTPITIPTDELIELYTASEHVGIHFSEVPPNVVVLGRETDDFDHYPLTLEDEKHLLWGFTASPDDMTQVGQDIFINVVDYMTSSTEFDIYFADADESPGSVYHYDIASGMEETVYTRPSKRLYSFAFHPQIPEKLYYVNANEYKIYRTHQISSGWAPEEVVYTHTTYIRDIAFAFDSNGELGLYFSEATGAGEDGKIYRIEDGYAIPYYTVKLADVDRSWAGDFAFDAESNLYLSSGNRVPARIYKLDGGSVEEIYKDEKEPIKGLVCEDGVLYYANWRTKIYRLDTDTGERTVVYSNPEREWLSDVGFR